MPSIPTAEPSFVTAGDTVTWSRSLQDYPASAGWVLKYRLINASGKIDITASASGDDHLVVVAPATTALWVAGDYTWQAYVEKSSNRYTVGSGSIEVRTNLAAEAAGYDTRSTAKQILDQLEAAYSDYCTNGQGLVQQYAIGGRQMQFRDATDFISAIEYWRAKVQSETALEQISLGLGNPRRLYVRFR